MLSAAVATVVLLALSALALYSTLHRLRTNIYAPYPQQKENSMALGPDPQPPAPQPQPMTQQDLVDGVIRRLQSEVGEKASALAIASVHLEAAQRQIQVLQAALEAQRSTNGSGSGPVTVPAERPRA